MPSPPDVILVLSPRMAKVVRRMSEFFVNGEEIYDDEFLGKDIAADWRPDDDLETSLEGLINEIGSQLSRGDGPSAAKLADVMNLHAAQIREEFGDNDAARIADKMAKAARGAVEGRAVEGERPVYTTDGERAVPGLTIEGDDANAVFRYNGEVVRDDRAAEILNGFEDDLRGPDDGMLRGEEERSFQLPPPESELQ